MSDLYTSLLVTPRKKRALYDDDDDVLTPKKARSMLHTPPASSTRQRTSPKPLPDHFSRFQRLQTSLQLALSHALATSAVAPTSDTGVVPNVLNHLTLTSAVGLRFSCSLDDLRRLCWLWEWDGQAVPCDTNDSDDPFLDNTKPEPPKQWSRGAMGFIVTPTMHLSKDAGKRVPAYGLGIEVELDLGKDLRGGMAAVARWTAAGDRRKRELTAKLNRWVKLHPEASPIPLPPLADLPALTSPVLRQSALTQRLASLSPKSSKTLVSSSPSVLQTPPSPSRSLPPKPRTAADRQSAKEFAIPFPITSSSVHHTAKSSIPFPQTPSSKRSRNQLGLQTPQTPSNVVDGTVQPSTPANQLASSASTPSTPATSRRAALYERIRKRSESQPSTPSKLRHKSSKSGMTSDQLLKLGQEAMRRRCLLGRLGGVAESIWMLFTHPAASTSTSPTRKRRVLPASEVAQAILKSSPVPISVAEAHESIGLLTSLCPFFLKSLEIASEDWLEMPSSSMQSSSVPATPTKSRGAGTEEPEETSTLSPRRVKKEAGGLREVRERIKRELEIAIE